MSHPAAARECSSATPCIIPIQLLFPELSSRADGDMNASRVTRRALIERHADTGNVVMPHHFATPSSGTIKRAGDGFRFAFIEGS